LLTSENLEKKYLVDYFFEVKKFIETKYGTVWEFNLRDLHRIFEYLDREQTGSIDLPTKVDYICDMIINKRITNTYDLKL